MDKKIFESFQGETFLVTGGAGFIGSNLCETLLSYGCFVKCLDNFYSGKKENIMPFINHPNFTLLEGDIQNFDTCMQACENVSYVLHQAALGSVPASIKYPVEYSSVNITGTINLLESAKKCGVKKFVYASSSSVYGNAPLPNKEGQEAQLLSPYALTKKSVEDWAKLYKTLYHLDTYGLRYFNVYGKRQDPNGMYAAVIPKFISILLKGENPTIYGDGTQTRDFTYIDDVITANLLACKCSSNMGGNTFNIAYGERKSVLEVYKTVCSLLNKPFCPQFAPAQKGEIKHSYADLTNTKQSLDFEGEFDFLKGLSLCIEWYQKTLS